MSVSSRADLATLDDAAFGAASDVTPKFVSPSDPAAQQLAPLAAHERSHKTRGSHAHVEYLHRLRECMQPYRLGGIVM
jgi:hypothetical protein